MNRKAKFKTGIQFKLDRNKHKLRQFLGDFARQEDGVMLAFVLFLLLIMMTVGGVSVDLMRAELARAGHPQDLVQILPQPVSKALTTELIARADLAVAAEPQRNRRRRRRRRHRSGRRRQR